MDYSNVTTEAPVYLDRPLNVPGLVVVLVFYGVILLLGIWATWKNRAWESTSDEVMLAGRNLGSVVGVFTLTATWVGGGYINGTAEFVFRPGYGLAWTQAMWGFTISLIISGAFYAKPMRAARYVTMLDPFKERYGDLTAALMYIPAVMGELFWSGAILSALGASLAVILGIKHSVSIIISAGIAVLYTVCGGLYSVVLTDVVQIFCIFFGLWLGAGFAFAHPAVSSISETALGADGWIGQLAPDAWVGNWLDYGLLLIFGGIPWQVYFQRVLSAKTPRTAQLLSFAGAAGCLFLSIPAIMIGAIAKSADWNQTEYRLYGKVPIDESEYPLILPMVLQYLTPTPVAVIGLGAVSAAVMSSADSSLLSVSSMFSRNVYKPFRDLIMPSRPASDREVIWVLRISVCVFGVIAAAIAIGVRSIYQLFVLCGDFVYVVAFPQLTCVLFYEYANTWGALAGYIVSFFFRLTAGEQVIGFPELFRYPYFDEESNTQLFPFRTLAMLLGLITIIVVSYLVHYLVATKIITTPFITRWTGVKLIKNREEEEKVVPRKENEVGDMPPEYNGHHDKQALDNPAYLYDAYSGNNVVHCTSV